MLDASEALLVGTSRTLQAVAVMSDGSLQAIMPTLGNGQSARRRHERRESL